MSDASNGAWHLVSCEQRLFLIFVAVVVAAEVGPEGYNVLRLSGYESSPLPDCRLPQGRDCLSPCPPPPYA